MAVEQDDIAETVLTPGSSSDNTVAFGVRSERGAPDSAVRNTLPTIATLPIAPSGERCPDPLSLAGLEHHTARLVNLIGRAIECEDRSLARSLRIELLIVRHEVARLRHVAVLNIAAGMSDPHPGD